MNRNQDITHKIKLQRNEIYVYSGKRILFVVWQRPVKACLCIMKIFVKCKKGFI